MNQNSNVIELPQPSTEAKSGIENEKEAPPSHLPDCPFCHQDDELEILDWTTERRDGSEFIGEAVRCNRCDAFAPLAKWLDLFSFLTPVDKTPSQNLSQK